MAAGYNKNNNKLKNSFTNFKQLYNYYVNKN